MENETENTPSALNTFVTSEAAKAVRTMVDALIIDAMDTATWQHVNAARTGLVNLGVEPIVIETEDE